MKKLICIVLCLVMIFSVFTILPFEVGAKEVEKSSVGIQSGDYYYEVLEDGTVAITDYTNTSKTSLEIPGRIDGKLVTSIGRYAFEGCTSLTSVTIGNSVTSIEWGAFCGCTSLTSITIPNSVTSIGEGAFRDCTSLTSITIPDSVTSIGRYAFYGCASLMSITIPNSVTSIGRKAFGYYYDYNSDDYKKIDNFTIYGTKSGEAERYAKDNGFAFVANQEKVFEAPENDVQKFTDLRNLKLKANLHYAEVDPEIKIPFSYDFFSSDNVITQAQTYNNNLATLGLVLATEAGFTDDRLRECFCVNGNDDSKLIVDAYRAYNFTKYSEFWNFDTDNPACAFAYKKQLIDGKEQNVFFIIVRGSTDIGDWITDVKILSDGFQKSANNVKGLFKSFVEYNTDVSLANLSKSNNKFFVVGHSLGAAVVDDLSPLLYDYAQQKDIYTYAFATPKTVKNKSIDRVSHIHNILNASDVVTDVGVSVSGTRHGQEVRFSSYNSNIKEYFDKMHDYSFDSKVYEICKSLNVKDSVGLYHSSDAYLSYLLTRNDKKSGFIAYPYKKAAVRCPVDVEIYNSKNELVGKIANNEVQEIENQEVIIQIDDDEKYIFMPFEDDYSFKLTGNDSGTMDISFEASDENGNEINKQFTNVPLEKGKEFSSDLNDKEIDKTKLIESESDKEYLTGDADGNGNVNIIDCTVIQRRLANLSNQSFFENLADTDHDKRITIIDATTIQKYLAHII
ncbi:MAG: leucine-rich repeat protein, partial [Oscillospiraceae bacterium]|nr:leucine-rich repeat protein [Candidatus Ruminococcus equi]